MRVFKDTDAKPEAVKDRPVAIIGYGSQGRAHALNLRDSGCDVIVGLRDGSPTAAKAKADGLNVMSVAAASKAASLIAILTPDMSHETVFASEIAPNLADGNALLVAHGFTVLYDRIAPAANIDVILVAPKGPGDLVRREYERGAGVPALFAVHQDASGEARDKALAYASLIGGTMAGAIETTFREETETDLFGEQAVLCGGATELVLAGYETLTDAGYAPEIAYYECLHELKLIVDLLYEGGLAKMHEFISETAIYGDLVSGPRVINAETRARMQDVLTDIQNGNFAKRWIAENEAGKPEYDRMLQADLDHPIEKTGKQLRAMMPWLKQAKPNND